MPLLDEFKAHQREVKKDRKETIDQAWAFVGQALIREATGEALPNDAREVAGAMADLRDFGMLEDISDEAFIAQWLKLIKQLVQAERMSRTAEKMGTVRRDATLEYRVFEKESQRETKRLRTRYLHFGDKTAKQHRTADNASNLREIPEAKFSIHGRNLVDCLLDGSRLRISDACIAQIEEQATKDAAALVDEYERTKPMYVDARDPQAFSKLRARMAFRIEELKVIIASGEDVVSKRPGDTITAEVRNTVNKCISSSRGFSCEPQDDGSYVIGEMDFSSTTSMIRQRVKEAKVELEQLEAVPEMQPQQSATPKRSTKAK